jgi:hypothetical protein
MHAGFSFSDSPISLLLRQPLSIKKSYAGAIQYYTFSLGRGGTQSTCTLWVGGGEVREKEERQQFTSIVQGGYYGAADLKKSFNHRNKGSTVYRVRAVLTPVF